MEASSITDEAGAIAHALTITGRTNGDDAAVLRIGGGAVCVSTDSTVAGVHAPAATSPHALGRRAAARALSDLAAMGALPAGVTCAVHVPEDGWDDAAAALDGVRERATEQGAELVGGDFTRTPSPALALVVTVLGRRAGGRRDGFVPRDGMRPGDVLLVTGLLGASLAALDAGAGELPEPPDRLRAGAALARFANAMIDCSDGLGRDVVQLAERSRCGIALDLDAVPASEGQDPLRVARAGDDYELIVAIAPQRLEAARVALAHACPDLPLTRIGVATDEGRGIEARLGGARVSLSGGFLHT